MRWELGVCLPMVCLLAGCEGTWSYRRLHRDEVVNADLWSQTPGILSAYFAFDGIIGVDGEEAEVRAAGGAWNVLDCADPEAAIRRVQTSSSTVDNVTDLYDNPTEHADAIPVVFTWPVLPSTVDHTDFLATLNTGEQITPDAAGIFPNFEYNERSVVVLFADFGNRILPGEDGARYVTRLEIVDDGSPLMLIGPQGAEGAVGLAIDHDTSGYATGPSLVGAKLSHLSTEGEGGPAFVADAQPNDGVSLYGAQAQYRLRMYTNGGVSPDGVRSILPTEFERFFRLHALGSDGATVLLTTTGVDYEVAGGSVRVVGLADLGRPASAAEGVVYDDCYYEDHDNYVDVVLAGDEAAMRSITYVEIPASGAYDPLYNPGGPGNDPTLGVVYTAPGPPDLEPVLLSLDDPMTVSWEE